MKHQPLEEPQVAEPLTPPVAPTLPRDPAASSSSTYPLPAPVATARGDSEDSTATTITPSSADSSLTSGDSRRNDDGSRASKSKSSRSRRGRQSGTSSTQSFNFSRSTDEEGSVARHHHHHHGPGTTMPPAPYDDAQPTAARDSGAGGSGGGAPAFPADRSRTIRTRNKGLICENYFHHRQCPIGHCPLAHVYDGEIRSLPKETCMFFNRGSKLRQRPSAHGGGGGGGSGSGNGAAGCLRDTCQFFHGSRQQLRDMKAADHTVYRPQDFMELGSPWDVADAPPLVTSAFSEVPEITRGGVAPPAPLPIAPSPLPSESSGEAEKTQMGDAHSTPLKKQ